MKIVLLSGGSGTRLWPLSNKQKPKQFLEILKCEDSNQYESMFQRVLSQIEQLGMLSETYISTNKHQKKWIERQSDFDIPIIVEPECRDTFPAISLAAVYLSERIQNLDEVICVCPVDVFTDNSFFQTLSEAEKYLKEYSYNLALIGIEPTYPSEKYGYILHEKLNTKLYRVKQFIEKPKRDKAIELISQNALWNGGVFCVKLKFLLDLLHHMDIPLNYQKLSEEYGKLPKISFDYEVVEKLQSVIVVPYKGVWSDLGTWDILTKQMNDSVIGVGYMSEDSTNSHIINHLDIPVLGVGLQNLVVVTSDEGILVSEKSSSTQLKDLLKRMKSDG